MIAKQLFAHYWQLLLMGWILSSYACQQSAPVSALVDSAAIHAAVEQADTISAQQAYQLAQALPNGTAQDSFYKEVLQRTTDQGDVEGLRQHLSFYQQLRGGDPGADILIRYRSSDVDVLESNYAAGVEKISSLLQMKEATRDTSFYITLLRTLGGLYRFQGKDEEAMQRLIQALDLAAATSDSVNLVDGWMSLGEIHSEAHEPDKALSYLRRAVSFYEKTNDKVWAASCYRIIAYNLFEQKDTANALLYMEKCIKIREELKSPPYLVEAYLLYAKLLNSKGDYAKSLQAAQKAEYWHQQQPVDFWAAPLEYTLGTGLLMTGKIIEARPHLLTALQMARQSQEKGVERKVSYNLYLLFKAEGHPAVALDYLERSDILKDSLFTTEKEKTIQNLMVKYETAQKENRLVELERQHKIIRLQALIGLLVLTLALGIVLFLFVRLRYRRARLKQEYLVLEQAAQIAETRALLQEQALARSEVALRDTHEELHQSTRLLALKTQLVADLEMRIAEQVQANEERPHAAQVPPNPIDTPLYRMKILTEADWQHFRESFEQNFPGFLYRLRLTFPQLTTAETRLFLLLKLGFDTKEMAGILGISLESVWKSRQRLRKKLALGEETDFDGFVRGFQ